MILPTNAAGLILLLAVVLFCPRQAEAADAKEIINIIECESSGKYNAIGDGGQSYGIAQFKNPTFNELKKLANMPKLQYKNPIHQLRLLVWAIDHGYGYLWTCYTGRVNENK